MIFEIRTGRQVVLAEAETLRDARRACEVLVDDDGAEPPLDIFTYEYSFPVETYHGNGSWTTSDLARKYVSEIRK